MSKKCSIGVDGYIIILTPTKQLLHNVQSVCGNTNVLVGLITERRTIFTVLKELFFGLVNVEHIILTIASNLIVALVIFMIGRLLFLPVGLFIYGYYGSRGRT